MPNWKTSPKHLLLLAEFVQPRDPEDVCRAKKWQAVFGDDLRQTIRLFGQERLIIPLAAWRASELFVWDAALQSMLKKRTCLCRADHGMIRRLVLMIVKDEAGCAEFSSCAVRRQAISNVSLDEERRARATSSPRWRKRSRKTG
jgi:hypothetical protein